MGVAPRGGRRRRVGPSYPCVVVVVVVCDRVVVSVPNAPVASPVVVSRRVPCRVYVPSAPPRHASHSADSHALRRALESPVTRSVLRWPCRPFSAVGAGVRARTLSLHRLSFLLFLFAARSVSVACGRETGRFHEWLCGAGAAGPCPRRSLRRRCPAPGVCSGLPAWPVSAPVAMCV